MKLDFPIDRTNSKNEIQKRNHYNWLIIMRTINNMDNLQKCLMAIERMSYYVMCNRVGRFEIFDLIRDL